MPRLGAWATKLLGSQEPLVSLPNPSLQEEGAGPFAAAAAGRGRRQTRSISELVIDQWVVTSP